MSFPVDFFVCFVILTHEIINSRKQETPYAIGGGGGGGCFPVRIS